MLWIASSKERPAYDLPIALGTLAASGQIPPEWLERTLSLGELSLDGSVRHVRGVLPMAVLAWQEGFARVFVPVENAGEAALVPDPEVIPVASLTTLVSHLSGVIPIAPARAAPCAESLFPVLASDFREIKGHEHVKRSLEVAAAGGHNVLMAGHPGRRYMLDGALGCVPGERAASSSPSWRKCCSTARGAGLEKRGIHGSR